MTARVAGVLVAVALAGCGSTADDEQPAASQPTQAPSRVALCTDAFVQGVKREDVAEVSREELHRYVESSYCAPFERRGWVYADGTLKIAAYEALDESVACEEVSSDDLATAASSP